MFVGSLRLGPSCFVPMTWADPEAQELGLRTSAALFVGFFACQEEDQDQDQEEDGRASRFFVGVRKKIRIRIRRRTDGRNASECSSTSDERARAVRPSLERVKTYQQPEQHQNQLNRERKQRSRKCRL